MRRHSGDLGVWPAIVSNNCDGSSTSGGSLAPLRRAIRYFAVSARRRSGVCMEHLMGGLEKKGRAERATDAPLRRAVLGANDR